MHLHLLDGLTSEGSLSSLIHESYRLTELREVDAFELRFQPISTLLNIPPIFIVNPLRLVLMFPTSKPFNTAFLLVEDRDTCRSS